MNLGAIDVIPEFGSRLSYAVPRESEHTIKEKARKGGVLPRVRDAPLRNQLVARIREFQGIVQLTATLGRKRSLDTQMPPRVQAEERLGALNQTPSLPSSLADVAAAGRAAERVAQVTVAERQEEQVLKRTELKMPDTREGRNARISEKMEGKKGAPEEKSEEPARSSGSGVAQVAVAERQEAPQPPSTPASSPAALGSSPAAFLAWLRSVFAAHYHSSNKDYMPWPKEGLSLGSFAKAGLEADGVDPRINRDGDLMFRIPLWRIGPDEWDQLREDKAVSPALYQEVIKAWTRA